MKRNLIIVLVIFMLLPAYTQEQELSTKKLKELQKQLKNEQQAEESAEKNALWSA